MAQKIIQRGLLCIKIETFYFDNGKIYRRNLFKTSVYEAQKDAMGIFYTLSRVNN